MKVTQCRYLTVTVLAGFLFFLLNTSTAQIITTVAGNATDGYSGDGGPAIKAQLGDLYSSAIAFDKNGNMYFGLNGATNTIRKIDTSGIISTIAGKFNSAGFSGDGGLAKNAQVYHPASITVDKNNDILFVDQNGVKIREIDTLGVIKTISGPSSNICDFVKGETLSNNTFSLIREIAVDKLGNMFIVEGLCNRIKKVDTNGIVSIIAGNGSRGFSGDGGLAINAELSSPYGIAVDNIGNVYFSDIGNERIRKIDTNGIITTIAGVGIRGHSGDGGLAINAQLIVPGYIVIDHFGNIYFAEFESRIRRIDTKGIITTYAGNGVYGYSGDGGISTKASVQITQGCIGIDKSDNIYFADEYNFVIRKISFGNPPPPPTILSFTPNATCPGTSIPVFITGSNFTRTTSVTVGGTTVDSFKVNSATSITAFISKGNTGKIEVSNADGTATSDSVFTFGKGYIAYAYVANDVVNGIINVINTDNYQKVATIPVQSFPSGVASSSDGRSVYIANSFNNTVNIINTATNVVTDTIAVGKGPIALCFTPNGKKVYVSNKHDGTVSVINTATKTTISTIAMNNIPQGLACSPDGKKIYVVIGNDSMVEVINTTTDAVIKKIACGKAPMGICFSPNGEIAYVTNSRDGTISIIDAISDTVLNTIKIGTNTYGVCASKDGSKVYVSNISDSTISVISTVDKSLIARIHTGARPENLCESPDGRQVFVTNFNEGTISVINTATNTVAVNIAGASSPKAFGNFIANVPTECPNPIPNITSFTPNGVCPNSSTPVFIKGKNFSNITSVTVGGITVDSFTVNNNTSITAYISKGNTGKLVVTNANGSSTSDSVFTFGIGYRGYAYIATGNNTVNVYDAVTRTLVGIVPVGKGASSINASPDGSKVFVSNGSEGTVTIINTKDNTVETTLQMGNQLTRSCFSPDGSKFYQCDYASSNGNKVGNVFVINTANDSIMAIIPCGNGTYGVCISPDGTLVYATNSYDKTISVINTATNKVINTFSIGFAAIYIAISNDGTKLYIPNSSNNTVNVIDALTHAVITSIPVDNNPQILCLNNDGSKLYVDNAAGTTVNVINTANNTVIATIQVGNNPSGLSLSTDGTELFVPDHDGNMTIINTLNNKVKATISIGGNLIAWGNFIANVHTCNIPQSIPSIISFTPNATCSGSKTTVNISGNYFGGATAVSVGGVNADAFIINSATSITAYISNGVTGKISVVTPFGTAVSDSTFTIGSTYTASVYVASYAGSLVNVIDAATKQITDTISVGGDALGVTVSHNGQRAYIGHFTTNAVSVINTASNKVIARIPVGNNPFGICISNDDARLYVANQKDNTVSVIATASNTVIATIPTGIAPRGICINPSGTKVYVANSNDNTISVINTNANAVTDLIKVGIQPVGICINPEGTKLYVVNDGSNSISVINTSTNSIIATVKVGSQPAGISISPDASKIYVANTVGNSVSVINTNTNTVIATVTVGKQPDALSVSPDGKEVYVANSNDGSVSVINALTNTVTATIPVVLYPSFFGNAIANIPTSCTPTPPPVISSFNPIVACAGATITIKGEGFTKITGVSFGNIAAASFKVLNDTTITAFVGNGASGNIVVSSRHGNASITGFTFIKPNSSTTKVSICQDSSYKFNGVTYTKAGTYSTHLINSGGCDSTAILVLSIDTAITLYPIEGNTSVCAGDNTTLTDITPKGIWSSDNNLIATVSSDGLVTGIKPGSTTIKYTILSGCGNKSTSQPFDVLGVKPSSIIYTPNKANCIQPQSGSITVSSVKGITKESPYHFSINEEDKFNIPYTISDLMPNKYTIYIYNNAECLVDAIYDVKIDYEKDATCDTLYVPSAFVPTSKLHKGINRVLRPFGGETSVLTLTFRVYNRYGKLIYETHELNEGWDGTVNGVLQDAGAYIWTLEYTKSLVRHWSTKGTSVLIR